MQSNTYVVPRWLLTCSLALSCMAFGGCRCFTDACLPIGSAHHLRASHCTSCGPGRPCKHGLVEGYSPPHYGYAPTCWQRFPADWQGCPPQGYDVMEGPTMAPALRRPEILPEPTTPYYEPNDEMPATELQPMDDPAGTEPAVEEPAIEEPEAGLEDSEYEEPEQSFIDDQDLPADQMQPEMPQVIRGAPRLSSIDEEVQAAEEFGEDEYIEGDVADEASLDEPELISSEMEDEPDFEVVTGESDEIVVEYEEEYEEPLRLDANP